MDFKQLQSFVEVVRLKSFTQAARQLYTSQPTVSTHIRLLEEELQSRLILRTTKSIEVTPRGQELYDFALTVLEQKHNLIKRWTSNDHQMIQLGASTIPSAYILPEILPDYGNLHPQVYFVIHQSDSQGVAQGVLDGNFDLGMSGMDPCHESLTAIPFYQDRMVLITPVSPKFLEMKQETSVPLRQLLKEPVILREQGSGSKKSADHFLDSMELREEDLQIVARINDQESIKNLVAGGLGVSIISEKAAQNFVLEKRLLSFELPAHASSRSLYLIYRRGYILKEYIREFISYVQKHYLNQAEIAEK